MTPDFAPAGFFALRTPLLPVDELVGWNGDRAKLAAFLDRPDVREALFVASPALESSLGFWKEKPEGERGRKVERSLVRYFQRMAGRSTPFGLFAGCSLGEIGAATRLRVGDAVRRHTRLDMGYVSALTDSLERTPALREALVFRPNSSLYRAAGRFRYHESRWIGKRVLRFVGVEASGHLEATLDRAAGGATLGRLAAALVTPEIAAEEARAFVEALVDAQILVSDLDPAVTGPEPIHGLVERLRPCDPAAAERLERVRADLAALDAAGLSNPPDRYRETARRLEEFSVKTDASLFQVDLSRAAEATLAPAVTREILRGVGALHRLFGARSRREWDEFAKRFHERYQDRDVPLAEALDEEAGVGFEKSSAPAAEASPLLAGLAFGPRNGDSTVAWDAGRSMLVRKIEEAQRRGATEIVLEDEDLGTEEPPPLPDAISAFGTILAASEEAVDRGEFRFHLKSAGGPSGAQMLGRFCHLDDGLLARVRDFLRAEERLRPDAIFAEVVHAPAGRHGNVISRPVLRDYEIPFLGASAVPADRQIPIQDLMVSVREGRVVLRSKRLGREVLPRMTNAHNYRSTGLGVYKFLCRLQHQGTAGSLAWDWGPFAAARFLPRVRYGRTILAPARWLILNDEVRDLARIRRERHLPRFVTVADGDATLPVDLDNPLSVETFVHLVKDREAVALEEMAAGPEDVFVRGPGGRFVHEIVVPFLRAGAPVRSTLAAPSSRTAERTFAPGSEWLHANLYCGTATADGVLRDLVRPLAESAIRSGAADRWFFVRYGDPEWHLRVRFHGRPERLLAEVLPALHRLAAPLVADGRISRVQLDTYEREVERYGGPDGVAAAERLFWIDSEAAAAIVGLLPGDEGLDARWRLALLGMDLLLDDLGLASDEKLAALERIRDSYRAEFRSRGILDGQIGQKFRHEKTAVEALLDPSKQGTHPLARAIRHLRARSERLTPVVAELRDLEARGRLAVPMRELAASLLHMHSNRMLRSAARAQELVLVDFLARIGRARAVRNPAVAHMGS
ncbi:MAG: lantibiotic dehydratase [Planctomycetes bacterium]|nr:lantibiotic dehydratase [Planctomycetota bacterium]